MNRLKDSTFWLCCMVALNVVMWLDTIRTDDFTLIFWAAIVVYVFSVLKYLKARDEEFWQ